MMLEPIVIILHHLRRIVFDLQHPHLLQRQQVYPIEVLQFQLRIGYKQYRLI
jgi:hypothetical protein